MQAYPLTSRFPLPAIFLSLAVAPSCLRAADEVVDGGASVTVPGSQTSPWDIDGRLTIGDTGSGTLAIGAGGSVSSVSAVVGNAAGSTGSVTISGADALWNNTGINADTVTIGRLGTGTLDILAGGRFSTTSGFFAGDGVNNEGSGIGRVTVSGADSQLSANGIQLGRYSGSSGTLTISSQGKVTTTGSSYLGSSGSGTGSGTVLLTGAGSDWTASNLVGVRGVGSSLTIEKGASANFGAQFTLAGTDTVVVVDGVGSELTVDGTFGVQNSGDSSGFTVRNGGRLESTTGSAITIGSVDGSTLSVESGGTLVTSASVRIGGGSTTRNGAVTVTGTGSTWTSGGDVIVGYAGSSSNYGNPSLTIADNGKVTVKNGTGIVTVGGGNYTNAALNIGTGGTAGILEAATVTSATSATATGQVNFNHSDDITFSANLAGARLGVTKAGSGVTVLTGDGTYELETLVNAGTLLVHGSLGNTAVTVAAGATFGGNGTHSGTISLQGTVSPGASAGTFTTGAIEFAAGSEYLWELGDTAGAPGTGWDLLDITGALSFSATAADPFLLTLAKAGELLNFDPARDYSFIIAGAGSIASFTADAVSIDAAGIPESAPGSWSIGQDGNSLVLSYTAAVPEPSSAALGVLGLLTALSRRRR